MGEINERWYTINRLFSEEGLLDVQNNLWCVKFIKYFIGNNNDLINVNLFRKRLNIDPEVRFEVGIAKAIYLKKIELGIQEREVEISYQHSLFIVRRMQTNLKNQFNILMTYLYTIPTDQGVAFIRILLEKELAFNSKILEVIKNGSRN